MMMEHRINLNFLLSLFQLQRDKNMSTFYITDAKYIIISNVDLQIILMERINLKLKLKQF